jgi:ABC transport system ATP-binding/permease protein
LAPVGGRVRVGRTVEAGLYEQQAGAGLDPEQNVLDSVVAIAPHVPLATGETLPAHRLAERFGFDADLQRTPIGLLSGGERRRVALLHLLVAAPNVLLLDEPTNDLDLDTLATLEDYLDGFTGTLLVASHDRYVLDRLTDRTLEVADGRIVPHLDVDAYRTAVQARRRTAMTRTPVATLGARAGATTRPGAGGSRPPTEEPATRARVNQRRLAARRTARSLERRVERLTDRRDALHDAMTAAATDPDRLVALQAELIELDAELAAVEDAWLEAAMDADATE